jgi:hypothetical protein
LAHTTFAKTPRFVEKHGTYDKVKIYWFFLPQISASPINDSGTTEMVSINGSHNGTGHVTYMRWGN